MHLSKSLFNKYSLNPSITSMKFRRSDRFFQRNPAKLTQLEAARSGGSLKARYRDQDYTLAKAGSLLALENGLRPGKEFARWDFRNEADTRQVLIQRKPWQSEAYRVYTGREIWLRDCTVLAPGGQPAPSTGAPPPAGNQSGMEA